MGEEIFEAISGIKKFHCGERLKTGCNLHLGEKLFEILMTKGEAYRQ
jgi:hypothetical protein